MIEVLITFFCVALTLALISAFAVLFVLFFVWLFSLIEPWMWIGILIIAGLITYSIIVQRPVVC